MSDDGEGGRDGKINATDSANQVRNRLSQLFEALADSRRRRLLYYLSECDGETTTTDDLAKQIAARETGYRPETLVEAEYADVRQALHHNHLPRLRDEGIVDFDSRSGAVRLRRLSRTLLIFLSISRLVERTRAEQLLVRI